MGVLDWMPVVGDAASIISSERARKTNKKIAREQMALQKEFAQHGLSWRVEDARAAGLHPLSALGAQLPAYSPVGFQEVGTDFSSIGQNLSRARGAQMTATQRELEKLALLNAAAQLKESDARRAMYLSEAARNDREANAQSFPVDLGFPEPGMGQSLPPGQTLLLEGQSAPTGQILVKPAEAFSASGSNAGMAAGETPLWRNFTLANGVRLALPGGMSGDAADVLESLSESPSMLAGVIAYNMRENPAGAKWLKELYGFKEGGLGRRIADFIADHTYRPWMDFGVWANRKLNERWERNSRR